MVILLLEALSSADFRDNAVAVACEPLVQNYRCLLFGDDGAELVCVTEENLGMCVL